MEGKRAIVTGSNVGLGLETSRQLLDLGVKVILAVRDESKGQKACQQLSDGRHLSSNSIEVCKLDLSSYDATIKFANRARDLQSLDIAVFNAGVYNVHESFSSTGYEESMQINELFIQYSPCARCTNGHQGDEEWQQTRAHRVDYIRHGCIGGVRGKEVKTLLPASEKKMTDWNMVLSSIDFARVRVRYLACNRVKKMIVRGSIKIN